MRFKMAFSYKLTIMGLFFLLCLSSMMINTNIVYAQLSGLNERLQTHAIGCPYYRTGQCTCGYIDQVQTNNGDPDYTDYRDYANTPLVDFTIDNIEQYVPDFGIEADPDGVTGTVEPPPIVDLPPDGGDNIYLVPPDLPPYSPTDGVPDGALALATSIAAIITLLGTLPIVWTNGTNPMELLNELKALINANQYQAPQPTNIVMPKDGDVNEHGEVWSTLSGGFVGRRVYEEDQVSLKRIAEAGRLKYDDDIYVRDAREKWVQSKKDHLQSQIKLTEKTAELLFLNIEQIQGKEAPSRFYTKDRDEFFKTTINKALAALQNKDLSLEQKTAHLDTINEMIERQGRPAFEPKKTTRDKIEDGVMRVGATAADLLLTKGAANALVSGFQTARDGILTGMSEGEALTRGSLQALVEGATAGIGQYAGRVGINPAIAMAGTNAAVGFSTSLRDQLEQGKDLIPALFRATGDGAFAGGTSFAVDKSTDIGLQKAQPYINKANTFARTKIVQPLSNKAQPYLDKFKDSYQAILGKPKAAVVDINPEVAGKLNGAKNNIITGQNGEKALPIEDAKQLMRDSRAGRVMKADPGSEVAQAHSNTVNQIKKVHDGKVTEALQKENPLTPSQMAKGGVKKEFTVEDFNTPGQKTKMSVDRDQRVFETVRNKDGEIVSKTEVPRSKWEPHSQKGFAEATNYNEADFRKTLTPAEGKAFDNLNQNEKLKFYQEKHGWKSTDKPHVEASIDNSDQIICPKTGQRITVEEPNIVKVKHGEGKLQDPEGMGLMYKEKVRDALHSEQPVEAFAQAKKSADTLDSVRTGYETQRMDVGKLKPEMRETLDVIKKHGTAAAQGNQDSTKIINETLTKNGFKNISDFTDKISSQFGSLKSAQWKGGTTGGAYYPYIFGNENK